MSDALPPALGAEIQGIIDSVLGVPGTIVGEPYAAYRVAADSSGDFPSGWHALGQTNVYATRVSAAKLEVALFAQQTVWFEMICDATGAVLGDVYVQADAQFASGAAYGAGATGVVGSLQFDGIAFAWHPPVVSVPIGARIDRRARILRSQRPDVIRPGVPTTILSAEIQNFPLVLINGQFIFGQTNRPASWVPVGLAASATSPTRPDFASQAGPAPPIARYFAYLPPLPGYAPKEGDLLVTEDGAQYVVTFPYGQEVGVVGWQMALDRAASQR